MQTRIGNRIDRAIDSVPTPQRLIDNSGDCEDNNHAWLSMPIFIPPVFRCVLEHLGTYPLTVDRISVIRVTHSLDRVR